MIRPAFGLILAAFLAAAVAARAGDEVTVENEYLRLSASAAQGGIVSLFDKHAGRELAARVAAQPLLQLEVTDPAHGLVKLRLTSREAIRRVTGEERQATGRTVRLEFSELGGRPVTAVCRFSVVPGDRYVRCRLEARLGADLVLESVRFPMLTLRAPAGPAATDALVLGATKGGLHRHPSRWKPGRSVTAGQPGNMAAQFICYYDETGGLTTMAFDARGFRKSVMASRTADGLSVAWMQPCFERASFRQEYDVGLTPFGSPDAARPADWRDAADLYKQWAVRQSWCARTLAQRDDLPSWIKEGPAMVRFGRDWLAQPERIEKWLRDYWPAEFPGKVPLVIAYWGWEKHGTWVTPDYFPAFPSDEQFRRLTALGRKVCGHTFLWPSGYHYTLTYQKRPDGSFEWDDRTRFYAEAARHAVHGRDGKPLVGDRFWLQGGQTATMCPGDPWTIDWLNRSALGAVERGAELVQIDQVVGGNFPACYRADHGHPAGPGPWSTDVVRRQLTTMLAACRKIDRQAVVCFEEPNEWFNQQVGIQDYRDWEVLRRGDAEPASVFNYLYHEYLPTFQSNPTSGNCFQAAWCLVTGQIPHMVPSRHFEPGPLLADGGLEEWGGPASQGWDKVDGYRGRVYAGRAERDQSARHSGQASLRLENRDGEMVQVSQNVAVGENFAPGRKYRLSAWMKTAELAQPNAIGLAAFAGGMKPTGSWRIAVPAPGDWTRGEAVFTLPESSEMLRIMIHINGRAKLWVDDLRLEEIRPGGRVVKVQRPRYPAEQRLIREWVELFHGRGRPYLALGRMLHPPRLVCATVEYSGRQFPAIMHNAFAASDGSEAVVLANPTADAQKATLTWHGKGISLNLASQEVRLLTGDAAEETVVSPAVRAADGILIHTVRSPYQSGPTEIRLLLPDRLEPARRYRALYVLPVEAGNESRYGDGLREAKKADLANRFGLVCVAPTFAQLPWYADHPTDAGVRQESHLESVVLPAVERIYPVLAEARGRLLVGFSKSGWGAWSLLLRRPDLFAAAGAWDAPLEEAAPKRFGMGPIFGTQENFEGYRISTLLERQAESFRGRPRLVLAGYGNFQAPTQAAHRRMAALGIPHVYRDGPQRQHVWGSGWLAEVVELLAGLDAYN